ncbi:MAG: preprotein translocase subunit SecA [Candidatus Omnitrophica bacterium]|nr:Protein translocase subunit SecA [bacterium]NUN98314.1 preprotein translocase subunit SecA [Candidatus Omnitrophota bacterium]
MSFLNAILTKIFGSKSERDRKRLLPIVERISALEPEMARMDDDQLRAQTDKFKRRLGLGESLDALLPEAFATVREAAKRVIGMRHFDSQLMGGIALYEGKIAEMATGEGKTLVATLPSYLIALEGKGVHIVTVNDYLAKRDMEWMGPIHQFLGLTVGAIQHDQDPQDKIVAYQADITYGTNNEFGFDYLRSNLAVAPEDRPQRGLHYAIVDEVDSILIDEARTPLIISGPADLSPDTYYRVNKIIPSLRKDEDFKVDEKERHILLTEEGMERAQQLLGLDNMFSEENLEIVHHLDQALRAHHLFNKDVHYVVQDGQVVIVDEFTGRLMPGRRWSDGLHQAVEAKEGVKIERENQTLATITFQNYFRMYKRLAGMTGTADTEAAEFREIYNLDVAVIPTNRPCIRIDLPDQVYRTEAEKFEAIVAQIIECRKKDQPALVGTISIEKSEVLADLLRNRGYWRKRVQDWIKKVKDAIPSSKISSDLAGEANALLGRKQPPTVEEADALADTIEKSGDERLAYYCRRLAETLETLEEVQKELPFNVLNAKYHAQEAAIVAQAGRPGAITIATNMAGRGTDIILGGNPDKLIDAGFAKLSEEVTETQRKELAERIRRECEEGRQKVLTAGGLMIIGTERHESRRIDNQLRGRCGRQGDPGLSRFFLSLEDDLMRLFGGERIQRVANRFGMEDGEVIEAKLVTRSIRKAQKKVEDRNFEIRKYVIKYDDVMNRQREVIYGLRNDLLEGENPEEAFLGMAFNVFEGVCEGYLDPKTPPEDWDMEGFNNALFNSFNLKPRVEIPSEGSLDSAIETLQRDLWDQIQHWYRQRKAAAPSEEYWLYLMRFIMLKNVDGKWMDHLLTMDHLKDSIGLRGYAGKDPQQEYQREGFELFELMYLSLEREIVSRMFRVEIVAEGERPRHQRPRQMQLQHHAPPTSAPSGPPPVNRAQRRRQAKQKGKKPLYVRNK